MLQYSLNNLYTPQKWEKFKKVTRCINDLLLLNICSSSTRELRLVSSNSNRNLSRTVFSYRKTPKLLAPHPHTHTHTLSLNINSTATVSNMNSAFTQWQHSTEKQPENYNSELTNQPFLLPKNIKLKSLKEQKRGRERLQAARLDSDKRLI